MENGMTAGQQHRINSGFGARSEPADVLTGINLSDKVAVVTGGYSGIGLETTRALANAGAKVHVPVRSAQKAAENLAEIPGNIVVGEMDLADLDSVRGYAERIRHSEDKLDLLINNAGIMACPETRVGKNWECQFATNHLGHFVLTNELLPLLTAAGSARVICLSSTGHKRSGIRWDDIHFEQGPYEKWEAYGQSKTANSLFALALDRKFSDQGVRAFAVHPGGILTPLQRHLEVEEMTALGWLDKDGNLSEQAKQLFKSPTQGCSTTLWAATSPMLDGLGGLYCENCDVADLATEGMPRYLGVEAWAVDEEAAMRLWEVSEQMLADTE
jgi:NAD(P)-dependent dehydrogenase (short-subunit alcohol dehydrogenase family)